MRGSQLPGDQATLQPQPVREDAAPLSATAVDGPDAEAVSAGLPPAAGSPWANLWQIPTILISLAMICWGLYSGSKPVSHVDFDGALAQVEELIDTGKLDLAQAQLQNVIEPNLELASTGQLGRFHAAAADYLVASRSLPAIDVSTLPARVCTQYAQAVELGLVLSPLRLERWADALLALGDLPLARKRLEELDAIGSDSKADPSVLADARTVRNRVFRHLVETILARPEAPFEQVMTMLADYRMGHDISPADEIWAIARQTELRLMQGKPDSVRNAVDLLLVEMRRLENRDLTEAGPNLGELYTLLGRGYFQLGEYPRAQKNLEHSLGLFEGPEPPRGQSLVLLGQIDVSDGQLDAALEHFQIVARDFEGTSSYLPGLLGRAEVQSMLGAHEESLADYRTLCQKVPKPVIVREVTPAVIAASLCDRCDAAVALGKLDRALDYVELVETIFPRHQIPAGALIRLASVHRQIADDLIRHAATEPGSTAALYGSVCSDIDPAVRREANVHYGRAGDYYLRHAGVPKSPSENDESSTSQWLAADSFDLGGQADMAIEQFNRYLESHAVDDPRRPTTFLRIAQASYALLDYEKAAKTYERLLAEHPRSADATQSYVPLARCYVALNRVPEAREQLQQVLSGNRLVNPDSADYRSALLELGRIEYQSKSHTSAIEAFTQFLQRYPTDPRAMEVRYQLAESYHANAMTMAERVKADPGMSPAEIGRLNTLCVEQRQTAFGLFAQVTAAGEEAGPQSFNAFQRDFVRRAALYQADCAYELGQFEQAIQLYDNAARQYSAHQSSMYALIQIVNAYAAMGDTERAAAAHHRALVRLKQLPDNAFAAPEALMDRTAWEQWLENSPVGPARTASASAPTG